MKNKTSIPFLACKGFTKNKMLHFDNPGEGEKVMQREAKVIYLFAKQAPQIKQAKVIAMFN